jgi:hypothetical protein
MDMPYKDYKEILLKILEVISFTDDKEAFMKEFINNVSLQAFVDLVQTLPQDKQEELKKAFAAAGENAQKINDIVKNYFSEEQINNALENAAKNGVTEWMKAVDPTLSDPQRQKLVDLSQQFAPPVAS